MARTFACAAALLAGCTLITDPSSFEGGEAPDMRVDAGDMGPGDMAPEDMGPDAPVGPPDAIAIEPEQVILAVGETTALTAIGDFGGEARDITNQVTFTLLGSGAAELEGTELLGRQPGRDVIRATLGDLTADAPVEVNLGGLPIFTDAFEPGFTAAFFATAAEELDGSDESFLGGVSLRVGIPEEGFAGFTILSEEAQDLEGFNAVTAWVRGAAGSTLNIAGMGIDLDQNLRLVERQDIPLTGEWQLVVVPLPDPSQNSGERGMFHVAEGSDGERRFILIDEIRYVSLADEEIELRSAAFANGPFPIPIGETVRLPGDLPVTMNVFGAPVELRAGPGVFRTRSSAPMVVSIPVDGLAQGDRLGTAQLTGTIAGMPAPGTLMALVSEAAGRPTSRAPLPPRRGSDDVIALFSDAYDIVEVDSYATDFSVLASAEELVLEPGDTAWRYEDVDFVAIETVANPIDGTDMTHIHFDIWIEGALASGLSFKLVDFGPNGTFDGPGVADDSEAEFLYDMAASMSPPRLRTGAWISFDIPLEDFFPPGTFDVGPGLEEREHLAQYIFGRGVTTRSVTFWLDNLYFYRARP